MKKDDYYHNDVSPVALGWIAIFLSVSCMAIWLLALVVLITVAGVR